VEESVYLNSNFFPDLSLELFGKFTLGESILIKAENNFPNPSDLSFYWEGIGGDTTCNNCPDLFFTPSSSGCQILEIMDQNGCFARDTICFDIFPERNVFVPNVFQPDNDGVNDFFSVFGDKSVKLIRQLKVYDRWGEEVFRGQNLNVNEEILGWDGTFNGKKLNPGVFIWQSEIEFIDGVILFFKGDVTLVR
jgi:gliding motility-associated-like protein